MRFVLLFIILYPPVYLWVESYNMSAEVRLSKAENSCLKQRGEVSRKTIALQKGKNVTISCVIDNEWMDYSEKGNVWMKKKGG